jgi:hypothetical protein
MPKANISILIATLGLLGCNSTPVPPSSDDPFSVERERQRHEQWREADCSLGPHEPKAYPLGIIKISARFKATKDPNNAIVGSVQVKCAPDKHDEDIVCGVAAIRNSVGYITDAKKFYGIYTLDREPNDPFKLKAVGPSAEKLCAQNGL